MKKSILLFIFWAVAEFLLTCAYTVTFLNIQNAQSTVIGWILYLCSAVITVAIMPLIRYHAKTEGVTWLSVVSKVLIIVYSVLLAVGLMTFVSLVLV